MDPFPKIRLSSRFLYRWKSSVHLFRVYPHETIVIATTELGLCPFCGSTDIRILYSRWRHAGFHGERGSPLVFFITCLRWISQIGVTHLLTDVLASSMVCWSLFHLLFQAEVGCWHLLWTQKALASPKRHKGRPAVQFRSFSCRFWQNLAK